MDRREFLGAGAALLAAGCARGTPALPPGDLIGTNHVLGHRLRDGGLPKAGETRRKRVVIVGAGISGLSAAWRLRRAGFDDFELLELESRPGGNARWGENAVSRYPWGSHYIPLPTRESRATRLLLAELGVLQGDPDADKPRYDERALCQAPQERHYRNGTWEEGLAPLAGRTRGGDGRVAALPGAHARASRRCAARTAGARSPSLSSSPPATRRSWRSTASPCTTGCARRASVRRRCIGSSTTPAATTTAATTATSPPGPASTTSPAATRAARDPEADAVLTWPEGNGFVVRSLMERYRFPVLADALVHRIEEGAKEVRLGVYLAAEKRAIEIRAEHVIWAAPFGLAARSSPSPSGEGRGEGNLAAALRTYDYAPWLTANLTLSEPPHIDHGAPLSWDNVIYDSPSLGYVVATHQGVATHPGPTVLTWYLPLAGEAPAAGRKRLASTSREQWAEAALADLARPHPEIRAITTRVDVFANGHAMVRPRPGLIWGDARRTIVGRRGRLHFAHADASGLSLFEEANDRGVAAAEAVLKAIGDRSASFRWS